LIVDDKEENLYLLRVLLQGNGYEVDEAHHGAEALDRARQNPPDLIIADILMPVMDGFALCREWKKDEQLKAIPFVFYTATYTDERDRKFALSLGAERFIIKPEEPDVFMTMVREVIEQVASASAARAKQAEDAPAEESIYLRQYNQALIRKLEAKMEQLEQANRALEQDIAARRVAEAALIESEARFRSLIESAPEGIFVQSGEHFVYANPAILRLLGADKPEDLVGTELMARIAPENHEAVRERIRTQRETGQPAPPRDQEYLRLDGSRISVETTAVAVRYQGRDAHLVFVRDTTERKRAEAEREKLQTQLIQAQKMESVGRLAGGVAHDFNNLLTVILGHAELALTQVDPGQPFHADLQEVLKAAQRSADLTRQLLTFARKQTVTPRVLDLNEAVTSTLKMLKRLIGEDIDLLWSPSAELWPIKVDPTQVDQILANLCVNARDAIAGVGKVTVETQNVTLDEAYCAAHLGCEPGEYVLLAVSDNGCGMSKETLEHLFEPFFTTKGVGQGTGLGLATVYGIVKQNNGHINVYSEVEQGTTFRIYLPRCADKTKSQEGPAEAPKRGEETVLLVEDEPAILRLGQIILERLGYTVLVAGTPGEAMRLAQEHAGEIQLLITDVVMPEMNGRDLSKRLLSLYPQLKRLFTSGYTAGVIAHRGVIEEGVQFLQKPFTPSTLSAKVREVLDEK
jgi:PAS domain S-box-containing protein